MKLISRFEAAACSTTALQGLLREAFQALAAAENGSTEHSVLQSSICHIQDELAFRRLGL